MLRRTWKALALLVVTLLLPVAAGAASPSSSDDTRALLQQAVDGAWRSAPNKARDTYRHPVETLQFFGIRPDMTVIELSPGGGWYTEILAPFLAPHGHLIEAAPPKAEKFTAKLKADPAVYGRIAGFVPFAPPEHVSLGPSNSADMVLTFRNTHDWLINNPDTLEAVFKSAFDVLKPGGVFGLTEHRAKPFADPRVTAGALHRIPEDYLIALALKTGFQLSGVSEINANPTDPEDINIHRLPPDLAGPEDEHAKMKAIGESDRMTLRFVKPLASNTTSTR
jgi:predicted methyltransferase